MIFPFMIKVSKETPLIHKSPKMARKPLQLTS